MPQHAITDAPVGTLIPAGFTFEVVGVVTQHFPRHGAVSVTVSPEMQIRKGDTLLGFVPETGGIPNSRTILANSIQLNHTPVEVGEAGQEIGLWTGNPLFAVGTTVIRISHPKPNAKQPPACAA